MKRILQLFLFTALTALSWGCYYDNEEYLYPLTACDTANVTFSITMQPIFQSKCVQCHNNVSPSGNHDLSTYDGIVTSVTSGRLMGAIKQESGYSFMPKNADKLTDCQISQISIWVGNGTPNN